MKAKSDEENKGGGAADARRWNGLRNVVESRALLKTAFRTASTLKAQVLASAPAMCRLLEACRIAPLIPGPVMHTSVHSVHSCHIQT